MSLFDNATNNKEMLCEGFCSLEYNNGTHSGSVAVAARAYPGGITTYAVRGQRPFPTEHLPINHSDDPIVTSSQPPTVSPAVRELPPPQITIDYGPKNDRRNPNTPVTTAPFDWQDPLLQPTRTNSFAIPSPILTFSGIGLTSGGSGVPPDTNGAVGPHHYVQMVNTAFAILIKTEPVGRTASYLSALVW